MGVEGAYSPVGYTITPGEWASDSSIVVNSRENRRNIIRLIEQSNGAPIKQILEDIRRGKIDVYNVSRTFIDSIRGKFAPNTVRVYRAYLPGFFQSVLGESAFSRTVFDRLCPGAPAYVTHVKQSPPREKVVEMLRLSPPLYRAVIGGLACGGFRIGEWLSRRMSDLEIRPDGYARVKLQAGQTKGKYSRNSFVTKEVVGWIMDYRTWANAKSEYVFPSDGRTRYLWASAAQKIVKRAFEQVGLKDSPDKSEIYSLHSFRTFAGDQLRECGLSEKFVLAIVGHKNALGAEFAYLDWRKIEQAWVETCADKMCFLSAKPKDYEQTKGENTELRELLTVLLKRITVNPTVERSKGGKEPNLNFTPLGAENPLYLEEIER